MILTIPPTLDIYRLRPAVWSRTLDLLRESGEHGYEAVVLWLGTVLDHSTAQIAVAVAPRQIAYRSADGCAVEVPPQEIERLVSALGPGQFVLARVHTHPSAAYHSPVDDRNLIIGHVGAISIVVPDFAAGAVELSACSVNQLQTDSTWLELPPDEVVRRFQAGP